MTILALRIRLHAPWVHSRKEKRMVVKSLLAKLRNKFNVSAAEVDEQDIHQIIVIGLAAVAAHQAQADSIQEEIERFVAQNTEAGILDVEREIDCLSKDQADYWPGRPKSRKQPGAGLALESSAEQIRLWNHPQSRFGSGIILGADSAPEPASEQIRPQNQP